MDPIYHEHEPESMAEVPTAIEPVHHAEPAPDAGESGYVNPEQESDEHKQVEPPVAPNPPSPGYVNPQRRKQ